MKHFCLLVMICSFLIIASPKAGAGIREIPALSFYKGGKVFELSNETRDSLAVGFDEMIRNCWLYRGERTKQEWDDIIKSGQYILINYTTPVKVETPVAGSEKAHKDSVIMSDAIMKVPEKGNVIFSPIIRHEDKITLVGKCSGTFFIKTQCIDELDNYFSDSLKSNCHLVKKWEQNSKK